MSASSDERIVTKRCVRRHSLPINKKKIQELELLVDAYAKEKDYHLQHLTPTEFAKFYSDLQYRDHLMHQPGGYRSPYGLQARIWKMACKDAWETLDKFWLAIAEEMKPLVYRKNKWNPEMKHYANWLLFRSRRIAALYARQTPIPEKISISSKERSVVAKILGMEIRKRVKCLPRTHMARSACFDANMYSVVQTNKGNQVICLMGLSPYKRISVPLVGYTSLSGNIRLVMEKDSQTFEIHTVYNLTPTTTLQEEKAGILDRVRCSQTTRALDMERDSELSWSKLQK